MITGLVANAQYAFGSLVLASGDPLSHVVPHFLSDDPDSFLSTQQARGVSAPQAFL
jgi:hypothetical protein